MAYWRNWSGRRECVPAALSFVRSEANACALVRQCAREGMTLRVAGAGHSHSPIVVNDSVIADASGLSGLLEVDQGARQAWISAGSPVYALGAQLHRHGLALGNQGDIDGQSLGGAIATGTHGTGRRLQNMSAAVIGLQLILASGEQVECNEAQERHLFEAARLGIGSVGFVTRIRMQLRECCVLRESMQVRRFDELFDDIPRLIDRHERFEFFWFPGSDEARIKTIDATQEAPVYPVAGEGARQAWSHEVLPSHRPDLHTEMEYSLPLERGPACFADIRELLRRDFPEVRWPVEYRTVAADDIWLSMASGRATVTISVHQGIEFDEEAYFRACEEIFLSYDGRPHWGKVSYLSADVFPRLYPHWHDWWRVRDEYDPGGVFLNAWARHIRPE